MKKYRVEKMDSDFNGMQETYDTEQEAVAAAKEYLNHLTDREKNKIEYFDVTEVDIPEEIDTEDFDKYGEILEEGKTVWTYEAEIIAEKMRSLDTWDDELCSQLCYLAGLFHEYEIADSETFESVVFKAAEILNVEIQ